MGSAIQGCCGEGKSKNDPIQKKMTLLTKKKTLQSETLAMQSNTDTSKTYNLSDQFILKLLGTIVKIEKNIEFNDFQIQGVLGIGGFGIVYLGQLKSNIQKGKHQKYAIKRVAKQLLVKKQLICNMKDQRDILAMHNRFLVKLKMTFQDPWFLYLVMEYAQGGDSFVLLRPNTPQNIKFKSLGQDAVRFLAGCVILALQFLHENKYMYRDLKPQNVLLFQNGYAKLTDFGLVKKSIQGQCNLTISGTEFYYAPQMVMRKGYNKEIDFWALGIYLYQISCYEPPFDEEEIIKPKFQQVCQQWQINKKWKNPNISPQLKDIISKLLRLNPNQRLGVKDWKLIKQHPFFKDFDWKELQSGKMKSPLQKIVDMFPGSIKPYRPQPPRQTPNGQIKKIEGWSLVAKLRKQSQDNYEKQLRQLSEIKQEKQKQHKE